MRNHLLTYLILHCYKLETKTSFNSANVLLRMTSYIITCAAGTFLFLIRNLYTVSGKIEPMVFQA